MNTRSLVLAALLATASAAHASPIAAAPAAAAPITWTLSSAGGDVTGSLSEIADFVASGKWSTSQAWSLFSSDNMHRPVAEMFAPKDSLMMLGFNTYSAGAVSGMASQVVPFQVPEPGSAALLLAGLAGFGFMARRRAR